MELQVMQQSGGQSISKLEVSDQFFNCDFNESLVHQVVTSYLNGARSGSKAQKTRGEVSGSTKKPWKQKGTGRARSGTIRSPIWRGGGLAFAAKPRDYQQKVNRKMYRGAMRVIFSELIRQDRLKIFDTFTLPAPKTRELVAKLKELNLSSVLVIVDDENRNLCLAANNLVNVAVSRVNEVDPVSLIAYDHVIITANSFEKIKEQLA